MTQQLNNKDVTKGVTRTMHVPKGMRPFTYMKKWNEVNVHTQKGVPVNPGGIANLSTAVEHVGCRLEEQTMFSNMSSHAIVFLIIEQLQVSPISHHCSPSPPSPQDRFCNFPPVLGFNASQRILSAFVSFLQKTGASAWQGQEIYQNNFTEWVKKKQQKNHRMKPRELFQLLPML